MALKEEKVPVTSGKKKASVRKETNAVSDIRVTIVHNKTRPQCRHTLRAILFTRSKCVEEEKYQLHKSECQFF